MRRGGAMTALIGLDIMDLRDSRRERGDSIPMGSLNHQTGKSLRSGRSKNRQWRIRRIANFSVRPLQSWWQKHELL